MDKTPRLGLPLIMPSQAQKHLTHNEALTIADALVQLSVSGRTLVAPPASPAEGERHIVAPGAGGDWAGKARQVASFDAGAWTYHVPVAGWLCWVRQETTLLVFDGAEWRPVETAPGSSVSAARVGINTAVDAANRLAVKSDAVLFSHDDATPGTGSMRMSLNRKRASDTASLVFQTNYSSRAEFGLAGDDVWRVKVSPDGSTWKSAILADPSTGVVSLPAGAAVGGALAVAGTAAPEADNAFSCGTAAKRWSTVYAATGVINTSDARDKIVIGTLEAVAGRIVDAVEPVVYRWRSGGTDVASADGEAGPTPAELRRPGRRRHLGWLAQDVRAALDAQGLDCAAWGLDDPGLPESRQWLRPDQMTALLWEALRETRAELNRLKAAIGPNVA